MAFHTTNDGSEFLRLRRYSLSSGRHEDVEKADWDITGVGFSRKGKYRVLTVRN
jgi:hypothetical protein